MDIQKSNTPALRVREATAIGYAEGPVGGCFDGAYPTSAHRRGRVQAGGRVCGAITAANDSHYVVVCARKIARR